MAKTPNPSKSRETTPGNAWMLTFADLLSLMLTFFVLVFSMNAIEFDSWKAVVQTMTRQFNPERPAISLTEHAAPESLQTSKPRGLKLAYLEAVVGRSFEQIPVFQTGEIIRYREKIVISLPARALFEPKQAVPKAEAVQGFRLLAGVLLQLQNKIQVSGHTGRAPVRNNLFRSNWELSLTRARVVAGVLAGAGYRKPINVLGYADTRFSELDESIPEERRFDLAERIDIVIIDETRERGLYDLF